MNQNRLTKTPENVRKGVLEWVNSQGYPLELQCQKILTQRGYNCLAGNFFLDSETKKEREIDLSCYKSPKVPTRFVFQFNLEIECKYARQPWVIFQSENEKAYEFPNTGILFTDFSSPFFKKFATTADWIKFFHSQPLLYPQKIGHGIAQSFGSTAKCVERA